MLLAGVGSVAKCRHLVRGSRSEAPAAAGGCQAAALAGSLAREASMGPTGRRPSSAVYWASPLPEDRDSGVFLDVGF